MNPQKDTKMTHFGGGFGQLCLAFFALELDFLKAAFLKDVPCEIAVFAGRGVPETLHKGVLKGVQKRTHQRPPKGIFLGVRFRSFFCLLDAFGAYLEAFFCHLVASWPPRPTKGDPREARGTPRDAPEAPKAAEGRPKRS